MGYGGRNPRTLRSSEMQFLAKECFKKTPLLSIPRLDQLPYTCLELRRNIEALAYEDTHEPFGRDVHEGYRKLATQEVHEGANSDRRCRAASGLCIVPSIATVATPLDERGKEVTDAYACPSGI